MLSDDVRIRLAQLRAPIMMGPANAPGAAVGLRQAHAASVLTLSSDASERAARFLSQAETCENASGMHLRFRRPLAAVWPAGRSALEQVAANGKAQPAAAAHPELAAAADCFPNETLFLDLETCGFAGSSLFLAGLIWQDQEKLVIDQLFARHYAEERALLETLWQIAARHRVLVTFNGKSFDWPMVHDRSTRHHLGRDARGQGPAGPLAASAPGGLGRHDARPQLVHCDLLHHARRRWKGRLPNCKLQTLERFVCQRQRRNDLSGSLVPAAYHDFVRTGDARPITAILHHNALDLATLVQLALALIDRPADQASTPDN